MLHCYLYGLIATDFELAWAQKWAQSFDRYFGLLKPSSPNPSTVLRDAAAIYKVDTNAIALKVPRPTHRDEQSLHKSSAVWRAKSCSRNARLLIVLPEVGALEAAGSH